MAKVETVTFNGRRYRRYPESENPSDRKYFRTTYAKRSPTYLHRDIWEFYRGPIPEGFDVHHKDEDPGNNALGNFECIPLGDHRSMHATAWHADPYNRIGQLALLDSIRPLTKAWHASPEGREKHREIGAQAYAQFVPVGKPCEQCGKMFNPRKIGNQDRFCSNACKSAWRRASGVDDETRNCVVCGVAFVVNRYSRATTCSHACGARLRWQKRKCL